MQMLHPFAGSIQQYNEQITESKGQPPCSCAMCGAKKPLRAHGFYWRMITDRGFDGFIRVRRYLCLFCRRTISLLPEFALPYMRFAITVIGLFLRARILEGKTLKQSAAEAGEPEMPYQRGQQWVRRFRNQATILAAALVALIRPAAAPDFVVRSLAMLEAAGWVSAHRFLFHRLRIHMLGWPPFLAPHGRRAAL
jgi:hypothetical protein